MNELKLVRCSTENSLTQVHLIREKVLFSADNYDRHHPDDRNPNHHCFIFLLNDEPVATVRLDFIRPHEAAIRLVAVLPEYQGQKIGSKMLVEIENYARKKGISKLVTNAAVDANKFYEAMGFVPEKWFDQGEGMNRPTIPMVKQLKPKFNFVKANIEEISTDQAEILCRKLTADLPEYFGIPSANEAYFKGVHHCKNLAAKLEAEYVGLLSLNFPYANNSNIYWMAVFKEHQKKGVGYKLIDEAFKFSVKAKATTMTVETLDPSHSDENYLKTYQFYQSVGFQPLFNLRPEGYQWTMIYMVKLLNNLLTNRTVLTS